MIRRFSIPRFVWWYTALAVLCVGGTFVLWSTRVWTPLQRHYLWTYIWCSRPDADPSAQVAIQWIWKTAPGRKPELAAEKDAISSARNSPSGLAMTVSPAAWQTGWTGLMQGPKERYPVAALKPFLQEKFFDGGIVWRVLSMPLLWGLALCCFLILGIGWLEGRLRLALRRLKQMYWLGQAWNRLRTGSDMVAILRSRQATRIFPKTPVPVPKSPSRKPPQPVYSPFGASTKTPKSAYAWSKKDEIE